MYFRLLALKAPSLLVQAALLLLDVIARGGRLKKSRALVLWNCCSTAALLLTAATGFHVLALGALRGMMPQLASQAGQGGFFTSPQARSLRTTAPMQLVT